MGDINPGDARLAGVDGSAPCRGISLRSASVVPPHSPTRSGSTRASRRTSGAMSHHDATLCLDRRTPGGCGHH